MIAYSNIAKSSTPNDDELVLQHVALVKRIAHHLAARLPSTIDVDDLMQSGMIGLLEASTNFDPTRGASFETYAGIRIRGAMLDDIRKNDWTPRSVHQRYRKVAESIRSIEAETGQSAEPQDVADKLGISIDEYHKILSDSASSRLFSLDEALEETPYNRTSPASLSITPEQEVSRDQFRGHLADAIEQLPEREKLVLSLYYERELNLKEIGEILDVTESRICQIHSQAIIKLKGTMQEQ